MSPTGHCIVKLCDFDSARQEGDLFSHQDGSLKYSAAWVAPEVYFGRAGKIRASFQIDIFAVGLLVDVLCHASCSASSTVLPATNCNDTAKVLSDETALFRRLKSTGHAHSHLVRQMCSLDPAERGDISSAVELYKRVYEATRLHENLTREKTETQFLRLDVKLSQELILVEIHKLKEQVTQGLGEVKTDALDLLRNTLLPAVMSRQSAVEGERALTALHTAMQQSLSALSRLELGGGQLSPEAVQALSRGLSASVKTSVFPMLQSLSSDQAAAVQFLQRRMDEGEMRLSTAMQNVSLSQADLSSILMDIKSGVAEVKDLAGLILANTADLRQSQQELQVAIRDMALHSSSDTAAAEMRLMSEGLLEALHSVSARQIQSSEDGKVLLQQLSDSLHKSVSTSQIELGEGLLSAVGDLVEKAQGRDPLFYSQALSMLSEIGLSVRAVADEVQTVRSSLLTLPATINSVVGAQLSLMRTEISEAIKAVESTVESAKQELSKLGSASTKTKFNRLVDNVKADLQEWLSATIACAADASRQSSTISVLSESRSQHRALLSYLERLEGLQSQANSANATQLKTLRTELRTLLDDMGDKVSTLSTRMSLVSSSQASLIAAMTALRSDSTEASRALAARLEGKLVAMEGSLNLRDASRASMMGTIVEDAVQRAAAGLQSGPISELLSAVQQQKSLVTDLSREVLASHLQHIESLSSIDSKIQKLTDISDGGLRAILDTVMASERDLSLCLPEVAAIVEGGVLKALSMVTASLPNATEVTRAIEESEGRTRAALSDLCSAVRRDIGDSSAAAEERQREVLGAVDRMREEVQRGLGVIEVGMGEVRDMQSEIRQRLIALSLSPQDAGTVVLSEERIQALL